MHGGNGSINEACGFVPSLAGVSEVRNKDEGRFSGEGYVIDVDATINSSGQEDSVDRNPHRHLRRAAGRPAQLCDGQLWNDFKAGQFLENTTGLPDREQNVSVCTSVRACTGNLFQEELWAEWRRLTHRREMDMLVQYVCIERGPSKCRRLRVSHPPVHIQILGIGSGRGSATFLQTQHLQLCRLLTFCIHYNRNWRDVISHRRR